MSESLNLLANTSGASHIYFTYQWKERRQTTKKEIWTMIKGHAISRFKLVAWLLLSSHMSTIECL